MTRGNQREMDRAKNAKKQSSQKKGREVPEGVSFKTLQNQFESLLFCPAH